MKVTIVGAGNMGRGIGTRTLTGGHQLEILDRDPAEAHKLAKDLGFLHISLQQPLGLGFGSAIRLLPS
jgi:3-hydroxyisobutyrate dehydrogenase-like beta-hydroxyacid dehydrogenase